MFTDTTTIRIVPEVDGMYHMTSIKINQVISTEINQNHVNVLYNEYQSLEIDMSLQLVLIIIVVVVVVLLFLERPHFPGRGS